MTEGIRVSSYCKHQFHICTKCGATFCSGECKSWIQAGGGSYLISNAISGHNNFPKYEDIKADAVCEFCKEDRCL